MATKSFGSMFFVDTKKSEKSLYTRLDLIKQRLLIAQGMAFMLVLLVGESVTGLDTPFPPLALLTLIVGPVLLALSLRYRRRWQEIAFAERGLVIVQALKVSYTALFSILAMAIIAEDDAALIFSLAFIVAATLFGRWLKQGWQEDDSAELFP
ncbi:MAG TPA: hypothetical protein ENJ56_00565 [Anaerolineae bacterium]|nr:hypothetical protein [Anaerolineae bacterium]